MKKQYMKPELETVEVMVELGFAQSQTNLHPTAESTTYIMESEGYFHQTQGEQWNESTNNQWF